MLLRCGAGGIRSRLSTRRTVEAPTRDAEAEQLALDPPVPPARVLPVLVENAVIQFDLGDRDVR